MQENDKLLTGKIDNLESLIAKLRKGEKIDPNTDADVIALIELRNSIQELKDNATGLFEAGEITQESASSKFQKTLVEYNKTQENNSNSAELINNNILIAEISDYFKSIMNE